MSELSRGINLDYYYYDYPVLGSGDISLFSISDDVV